MGAAEGGDLRQVGHRDDLPAAGQPQQAPPHGVGDAAGSAAVRFVEHQRARAPLPGARRLEREEEPGGLAAGSHLGDGRRGEVGTRAEPEFHPVEPVLGVPGGLGRRGVFPVPSPGRSPAGDLFDGDREPRPRDPEPGQLRLDRGTQRRRRLPAGRGQPPGQGPVRRGPFPGLGPGAPPGLRLVGQCGERLPALRRVPGQVVGAAAVAPLQPPEQGHALLDLRQPFRGGADRLAPRPDRGRQVLDLRERVAAALEQRRGRRIRPGGVVERPAGHPQEDPGRPVRTVERVPGGVQPRQQVVGVPERPPLAGERLPFPGFGSGGLDLLHRALHLLPLRAGPPQPRLERFPLPFGVPERPEGDRGPFGQLLVPSHFVHGLARRAGAQERQVLPLGIDLGQVPPHRSEGGHRGCRPVDRGPVRQGASGRPVAEFPADDEFPVPEIRPQWGERLRERPLPGGREVRQREPRFDHRPVAGGADQLPSRPAAEDQAERLEQHALAHAGLPGENIQTLAELERHLAEERHIAGAQPVEHRSESGNGHGAKGGPGRSPSPAEHPLEAAPRGLPDRGPNPNR